MKKIDPHTPLTDKQWQALGSVMHGIEGLPEEAQKAVRKAMRGRPRAEKPKTSISIRLDTDVLEQLRAHGKGWQTEVNQVLRLWVENRP